MIDRETYTALEAMDKINRLRAQGKTEEEIAIEFGFSNKGKADLTTFRDYLQQQSMGARLARGEKLVALMDKGYSLEDAGNELGLNYAEARTLSLWYRVNKGDK